MLRGTGIERREAQGEDRVLPHLLSRAVSGALDVASSKVSGESLTFMQLVMNLWQEAECSEEQLQKKQDVSLAFPTL